MTLGTNVPTPAWTNVPIAPQFYLPSYFQISNIQFGPQTQITILPNFGRTGNFVVGQQLLFEIPQAYGTFQLSGKTGIVTEVIDATNFKVNISTSDAEYSTFVPSPVGARQIPQVIPAGTFRTGNTITNPQAIPLTDLAIPGSFTNTQPNVGL